MKKILIILTTLCALNVSAFDQYEFNCKVGAVQVDSLKGLKKAPEHAIVALSVKPLKKQVPFYLIKANFNDAKNGDKEVTLFATNWTPRNNLNSDGEQLLTLLSFFYGYDTGNVTRLRAAVPTDILTDFAYLELMFKDKSVTKLAFEGSSPEECK